MNVVTTASIGTFDKGPTPWPYYAKLAELGEVVWDEGMNAWLVSSYRVMKEAALQDHDVWDTPRIADAPVSPIKGMSKEQWIEFFGPKASAIALLNGQAYNEQHRWWFAMFSPRVLKEWGDTLIEPIANRMLDTFIDRGHAELCEEYGERISPRVMTAMMGLPWDDEELQQRVIEISKRRLDFAGLI